MKRVAIYARVAVYRRLSTADQSCENQLRALRAYCRARGWEQVSEYVDQGVAGSRERRPALDKMVVEVKAGRVAVVIVATFDRLGRSLRHLAEVLELFRHLGVEFISLAADAPRGATR